MTSTCSVDDVVDAADGWHIFGTECPEEEIVLLCQVIVVSIYNLTTVHADSTLWTVLLNSSLGYLLPNPSMKREDGIIVFLVLSSNSSMVTHPNYTLAQCITNLLRHISLSGDWECGITEIHYPHDWYNVRNNRMAVEYEESVHNVSLIDGYYDSPETLVNTTNGEKPKRVQFSYNSVTTKVCAQMKNDTKFTLYGDLLDILGFEKKVWRRVKIDQYTHQPTPSSIWGGFSNRSTSIRVGSNRASSATRSSRC